MKIVDTSSLFRTLDNLNHLILFSENISDENRTNTAQWISGRQGLNGAYAGMFAPTDTDYKGIRLFTGDLLNSKASIGHILGEESIRALYLLNADDIKIKNTLSKAKFGINEVLQRNYKAGNYAEGTFCCGKCTVALWRNLSAEGVGKNKKYFESGFKYLKSLRDGKGRYKRFPFFYTMLALSDIDLPQSKEEIKYASEILRRFSLRKFKSDIYENRKIEISKKALLLID